jgi:hypothetical protein
MVTVRKLCRLDKKSGIIFFDTGVDAAFIFSSPRHIRLHAHAGFCIPYACVHVAVNQHGISSRVFFASTGEL